MTGQRLTVALLLISSLASVASAEPMKIVVGVHPMAVLRKTDASAFLWTLNQKLAEQCPQARFGEAYYTGLSAALPNVVDGTSETQKKAFRDTGTSVQIVSAFEACGTIGKGSLKAGFIAGCAPKGGPVFVREKKNLPLLAQVVAHEIGHAQGLRFPDTPYSDGKTVTEMHSSEAASLMYPFEGSNRWGMSAANCTTYFGGQLFPAQAQGEKIEPKRPSPVPNVPTGGGAGEFLKYAPIHGVDVQAMAALGPALGEAARAAVAEGAVEQWQVGALAIGYFGGEGAVAALDEILRAQPEDPEAAFVANDAKMNATLAYGYLAFQGDGVALARLERLSNTSENLRSVDFAKDDRDPQTLAEEMARMATVGLAVAADSPFDEVHVAALGLLKRQMDASLAGQYSLGVDEGFVERFVARARATEMAGPRTRTLLEVLDE